MKTWASFLLEAAIIAFPSHTIHGHIEGLVGVGIFSFSSVEAEFASALLASGRASVEVYICQGILLLVLAFLWRNDFVSWQGDSVGLCSTNNRLEALG